MPSDLTDDHHPDDPDSSLAAQADATDVPPTDVPTDTTQSPETGGEPASTPVLEHLDETIRNARQAADEALAPQRD